MFFDPFSFTPPSPAVLTRAVESYQRVAAARFCRYARDAANPDLWPRKMSGDGLEPTSKQLHAEIRALRHLTAIQRTLRELGGPLFDPDSPMSPEQRFRLVDRRLDAIEEALAEPDSDEFLSSDDSLRSSRPSRLEGSSSSGETSFYHPPEIEDLLEAVNFAQHVFAARAELLDKRRLTLSPEDFLLEIAALRDLTAIVRTLRRMSARPLPEDASAEDFQRELAAAATERPASSNPSSSEIPNPQSEIPNLTPAHPSHRSHEPHDFQPDPSPPSPQSPSESEESVKSVDGSSSSDPSGSPAGLSAVALAKEEAPREGGLVNSVDVSSSRPVPRVPEVRRITPRNGATHPPASPSPVPPSISTAPDSEFPISHSEISNPQSEIPNPPPSHPSHASRPRPSSEISNLKSEIPDAPPPDSSHMPHSETRRSLGEGGPSEPSDSTHQSHASHRSYAPPVLHDKDPP